MPTAAVGIARSYDRRMYFLRISLNDSSDDEILNLPGLDLEQAERFAGELRYEIEQAREVSAPVVQMTVPGAAEAGIFEPGRIIGIDLEGAAAPDQAAAPEPVAEAIER